jgi:hypothetical protein
MGMAIDEYDRRYAEATHRVMDLMQTGDWTVTEAAYRAAFDHGLGLNQYGRLVRETRERYEEME